MRVPAGCFVASLTYPDFSSEFITVPLLAGAPGPPSTLRRPLEGHDGMVEVFELVDDEDWGERLAGYAYVRTVER